MKVFSKRIFLMLILSFVFVSPNLLIKAKNNDFCFLTQDASNELEYSYLWEEYSNEIQDFFEDTSMDESYISYAKYIPIVNKSNEVIYIDFIGKLGFLVVNDNGIIEAQKDVDLTLLSYIDFSYDFEVGFVVEEDKDVFSRIYNDSYDTVVCPALSNLQTPVLHDGQMEAGDGSITDLNAYVADRYPDYKFVEALYLKEYVWSYQMDTSIYMRITEERVPFSDSSTWFPRYSEGNCTINAAYSMLYNLPTVRDPYYKNWRYNTNFNVGKALVNYEPSITSDRLYLNYGLNNHGEDYYNNFNKQTYSTVWRRNDMNLTYDTSRRVINNIPQLYLELRNRGIEYGYLPDRGLSGKAIVNMVEDIDAIYGYNLDLYDTTTTYDVIFNIKAGIPSTISVFGSESYNNHSMAVYGYAKYEYETKNWLGQTSTNYAYFWMVDSGHESIPRSASSPFYDAKGNLINWFDPNQCKSYYFVVINRNTLVWPIC